MSSKRQIGRARVIHLQNHGHITKEIKLQKSRAEVFQVYPNAIQFNLFQFYPSMFLLSFPVCCLSSSIVLSRWCDVYVNSVTICSVLKLPKIMWRSLFKYLPYSVFTFSVWQICFSKLWQRKEMLIRTSQMRSWH